MTTQTSRLAPQGLPAGGQGAVLVDGPVPAWCRDLVSCLQATFATLLLHRGHDPLAVLGAHWEFRYRPGDVRSEEFYFPERVPGDLLASIAPHHPVGSRWAAGHGERPLEAIATQLRAGRPVIAAVDNFHLPFRPAFGDVHAAHLLVVYGLDEGRGLVHVSDAMPPAFAGPISVEAFLRSWSSENPRDVQDAFFSDAGIGRRYLDVTIGSPFPALDAAFLHLVLDANRRSFAEGGADGDWCGRAGLARYLDDLLRRAVTGDARALEEAYPFGWGMQAQAGLHGELLRTWGHRHAVPALREAGRLVERVAHAWTGLRMTAAHGRGDPAAAVADLTRHARLLRQAYEAADEGLAEACRTISSPEGRL